MVNLPTSSGSSLGVPARALSVALALSIAACAASQPKTVNPPIARGAEDTSEATPVPPDPALERGTWRAPSLPDAGAVRWVDVELPASCRPTPPGSLTAVRNDANFEQTFCRSSNVDWQHYILYVYRVPTADGRKVVSQSVVQEGQRLRWVMQPAGCLVEPWEGSVPLGLLIERNSLPVTPVLVAAPAADCSPPAGEGYGY